MRKHTALLVRALFAMAVAMVLVSMSACGPKMIPGTEIEDNADTRAVFKTIEAYRKALEDRDAEALLRLASPNYFEKNGNNNSRDNYDYEGLVAFLRSERFSKVTKVRLVMVYKDLQFNADKTEAEVQYHYVLNFRKPPESFKQEITREGGKDVVEDNFDEERWYSKADDNLMVLEKDKKTGKWLIVRGM